MKKSLIYTSLFLLVCLILVLQIDNLNAEILNIDPTNPDNTNIAGVSVDNINDLATEIPENPEEGKEYIKQEWTKILEKNAIGRILLKISSILTFLNFFWKPILGIEYSFSWIFLFAITLFLFLFIIFSRVLDAFIGKSWAGWTSGFVVASLVGLSGVIKKATDLLSIIINNVWLAVFSFLVAILILILLSNFSGGLKEYLKKQKEDTEKEKTERAQKIIQTHGKVSKEELESYRDSGEGI